MFARRTKIGVALAAALVVAVTLPAQAAVIGDVGPTSGGTTVQVDVAGAGFTELFGGPASGTAYGLTDDHALYAWGNNFAGQVGDGLTTDATVPTNISASGALAGKTIVQVAGGPLSSVALASDGSLYTWGDNSYGQLAQPSSVPDSGVPVAVPMGGVLAGKTIVQVALGGLTVYALASDGSLFAWGDGAYGQLGTGATGDAYSPVAVSVAGQPVTRISAAVRSAVALSSNGTLYTWGTNNFGQLGNGTSIIQSNTPTAVTMSGALLGKTVDSVAAMAYGYLARSTDGSVAAWGFGDFGALGNGATVDSNVPVTVTGFAGKPIARISGWGFGGIALAADGTEFAWGHNGNGAIGDGTTVDALSAASALTTGDLSGKTISQVVGTGYGVLALATDGSVTGWGDSGTAGNGQAGGAAQTTPAAATMPTVGFVVGGASVAGSRVSSTRFSFTAPPHAAGGVDVVVEVGGNAGYALTTTTLAGAYTYVDPPSLSSSLPDPMVGVAYSQSVAVGSPTRISYAVTAGALPAGLSLATSTGVISGTPTASGTSTFTITATVGGLSSAQGFTVTTAAAPAPAPSATPTPTRSATPAPSATPTPTRSAAPTPSPTRSAGPTPSATPTPTPTPTPTDRSPRTPPRAPGSVSSSNLVIEVRAAVGADAQAAPVSARGSGLLPGSTWTLTLHSTPMVIAGGVVPASGAIAKSMQLPTTIAAGSHMLILTATSMTGASAIARTWFAVTAAKTIAGISTVGPVTLPAAHSTGSGTGTSIGSGSRSGAASIPTRGASARTGFQAMPWIGAAAALLVLVLGVLLFASRRRTKSHSDID